MYIFVLIIVTVLFSNLTICACRADNRESRLLRINVSTLAQTRPVFTAVESSLLDLMVLDIGEHLRPQNTCEGRCNVNDSPIPEVQCNILRDNGNNYINVLTNYTVTKNDSGEWHCKILISAIEPPRQQYQNSKHIYKCSFLLNVTSMEPIPVYNPITVNWPSIAAGVGVLVLLIIIGQSICIVHFKRKAKAVRVHASLSKRNESIDESARYCTKPDQKIQTDPSLENSESGIYEVLQVARVPEPPPLTTLPRNDNKISTLERIKGRLPMVLPTDDIYEVMESNPTSTLPRKKYPEKEAMPINEIPERAPFAKREIVKKNKFPKKEVSEKYVIQGFNTQSNLNKPALRHTNVPNGGNSFIPQRLPSELKEVFELRNRNNTESSPFNPVVQPLASPHTLAAPHGPRGGSPWAGRAPPHGSGASPGGPGGPGMSKSKPPPLVKPKKLYQPPQPPGPESIQVTTAGGDEDGCSSDEEWVYELLPTVSSFNIYSNT